MAIKVCFRQRRNSTDSTLPPNPSKLANIPSQGESNPNSKSAKYKKYDFQHLDEMESEMITIAWWALFLLVAGIVIATTIAVDFCRNDQDFKELERMRRINRDYKYDFYSRIKQVEQNEDIARLISKNNRLILKNKELKNMLDFDPKLIKYVVLKGESLSEIKWGAE